MSWQDIHGHFDFDDIYTHAVIHAPPNALLVEVGVMFGRSLMYLATEALRLERDDLSIIGIDPWTVDVDADVNPEGWGGEDYAEAVRAAGGPYAFARSEMRAKCPAGFARVSLDRSTSASAAASHARVGLEPYMVFIDGDHRYSSVRDDIAAWRPVVAPGGILAGHDYPNYDSVRRAVQEAFPGQHEVELIRSSWLVRL